MDAVFPIAQREGDAYHTLSDFTKLFDQAKSGRYLIGQGYGWHSGVHLTSKMLPWGKGLRPIQAMLDGKIVAFRIHSDYQVATYQDQEFKYSNNFVLIEHEVENPEDSEDVFKFYTLYMHLAPPSDIGANSSITTRYRLQEARNVRTFKHSDVPTNSGAKKQSMSKGTLLEYLYAEEKETHPYQIGKNTYKMIKCRVVENGESPSGGEKAMLNKIVWFASGLNSDFDILEDSSAVLSEPVSEPKWMSDNAAMIRDGSVVSLLPILFKDGIKVSAGEDIGYMGLHEYSNDAIGTKKDDNRVHIEMFSFDEPPEFFKKQISPKNAEENPLVILDGADSSGAVDMSNSFIQQLLESVTEDQVTDFSSFTARDAKVYLDGKRKHFERFIVKHPTDWHTESSQSLYESIHQTAKEALDIKCSAGFVTEEDYLNSPWRDQVMDSFDLFSQFELERADKFSWMQDLQGDLQLGSDKSLWHYWPFVNNKSVKRWANTTFGNLIGKVETRNDYSAYNQTYPKLRAFYNTNLDQMTIKEVMEKQKSREIFAAGRFQLIPTTLKDAVNYLGIDTSDTFSPEVQDRIFDEYLITKKRPNIIRFLKGKGRIEDAIYDWAKEFASAGVERGRKISKGRIAVGGESYYSGDGLNKAHILPEEMKRSLNQAIEEMK
ncbi:hypothetical protein [Vibrio campbellii]|uniref:hypothetical protein n=1 Tax=Vibrio campbellii TaxID=680 RepID=UPI0002ADDC3C|nr:hypothetical protein [Vibrio campbellii]ELU51582.1 hypothetical protein B878_12190 [Vibrio campbellii CAIM 519 = NBRC 15631 = ATCC 25920]